VCVGDGVSSFEMRDLRHAVLVIGSMDSLEAKFGEAFAACDPDRGGVQGDWFIKAESGEVMPQIELTKPLTAESTEVMGLSGSC
jgi:hypothetical protein